MTAKLPPAKDWQARDIDDWNTSTFHAYMTHKHTEIFGCDYVPFPNFAAEKGWLGDLIGTRGKQGKPRTASNADVKRFIDECFASYVPKPQYPGTSFGWIRKYRANVWQRIQVEAKVQERRKQAVVNDEMTDEEMEAWL